MAKRTFGHFATFDTTEVRHKHCDSKETKKLQLFPTDVPISAPPKLACGLTQLDVLRKFDIRVDAFADNMVNDRADFHINAWADTVLYTATATWFHAAPDDGNIQVGEFSTREDHVSYAPQQKTSRRITFEHVYAKPPKVIVWLNYLDMSKENNWRVKAHVTEITHDGFTMHLDTWGDTTLHAARASWIAHPADMPGVTSGSFNTMDMRPWNEPQKYNCGRSSFPEGAFRNRPVIMAGLNALDVDCSRNLRLKLHHDSGCGHGFNWHIDAWADTILYSAGASYIAFAV